MKTALLAFILSGCAMFDPANQWRPEPQRKCEVRVTVDGEDKGCMTRQQMDDFMRGRS